MKRSLIYASFAGILFAISCFESAALDFVSTSAACRSLTPAAIGGTTPPSELSIRWLGTTNFELVYRDQVILMDAYYDRGPRNRSIGFTSSQIRRANAIYLGHGHFDHMADAVAVALQTHAPVIAAATAITKALSLGLPASQAITVEGKGKGSEIQRYRGFTVEPVLAQHSILSADELRAFQAAITTAIGAPTAEESAAEAAIIARGTLDPRVVTEGTIAYLFIFDNGFRLIYRNSAGPITTYEQAAMARIGGSTDVAIVAYNGQYAADRQIAATLPLVKLYNPKLYIPAHHDETAGTFLDIGIEPLFMAIRDTLPETKSVSPLYREPICINVQATPRSSLRQILNKFLSR